MRIVHVPHAYAPVKGGAENLCRRVGEEMARRGHEVSVITANAASAEVYYEFGVSPAGEESELLGGVRVRRLSPGGWAYRLGSRLTPGHPQGPLGRWLMKASHRLFTESLRKEIERAGPDVVMTMPHLFVNVRCLLDIHRRRPFPLVLVPQMHEEDPHWPFEEAKAAFRQATALVANTEYEAARLRDFYGVEPERIFLAGLGVDLPSANSEPERKPVVLYLGRKSTKKGIPLLVKAMQEVWAKRPDAELVVAGTRGSDARQVDDLVAGASGAGQVRALDDITGVQKSELLSSSRVLVLPSRLESFGMVLLEAWSHKTPVVALDLPVLRSVVRHGRDGLLVKPGDVTEMARAILRLLEDASEADRMGRAGFVRAGQDFTWERIADRYLEAYRFAIAHG